MLIKKLSTICKLNTIKNKQKLGITKLLKLNKSLFCKDNTSKERVKFNFKNIKENTTVEVEGEVGQTLVDVAHKFKQDIEAACDQSLACSTCHVILDQETFKKLGEACEEEEDLLDLAFGLTSTSRLGCQIKISKLLEGKTVTIPSGTRNLYVDGHKPEPH